MEAKKVRKHIIVNLETYERLKEIGTMGDSFDSIIRKLLDGKKVRKT